MTAPAGTGAPVLPPLPALVTGQVRHQRLSPVRHGFRHRAYQWLVDCDDLPRLPWPLRPFAGFSSADHLGDPARGIAANVEDFLAGHGVELGPGRRIVMLANARVLGHVFDPLTVFWCLRADGTLACVVAEVHNTYGQRHAYLLRTDGSGGARARKELYVSPFFDVSGEYALRFTLTADRVATSVVLRRDGRAAFTASFSGRCVPVTPGAVARRVLATPLMPQRVSALIRLHGLWLWLRRLPVAGRPAAPAHPPP